MKINSLLKKTLVIYLIFVSNIAIAQLGVNSDNSAPHPSSMLDVKSGTKGVLIPRVGADLASPTEGLLYYNTTGHNFRYYDGTAWQNALFGNQWNVNGSKISYSLGNVGIGNTDPFYKLDVSGIIHNTSDMYVDGFVGIGTTLPSYKLQINNGSIALYNTTDSQYWQLNYNSSSNYFSIINNGTARFAINTSGNVGIGTTTPAVKLDVAGAIHTTSSLDVDGAGAIGGALTVNSNKGVAYNPGSATNLKVFPFTTATFVAILPGFGLSAEGAILFGGGFTSAPKVFVGDIDVTGGTTGELYRVQLILYGCSANLNGNAGPGCKARLLNTSPNPVNYSITWNCVAIGN